MGPLFLLGLASQQARWLTARQAVVAQNIANANTPGYRASDLRPFQDVMQQTSVRLATTSPGHIALGPLESAATVEKSADDWEVTASGNSVTLEQELLKAGDISRAYALNTGVVKAFQQMLLASVKGGA